MLFTNMAGRDDAGALNIANSFTRRKFRWMYLLHLTWKLRMQTNRSPGYDIEFWNPYLSGKILCFYNVTILETLSQTPTLSLSKLMLLGHLLSYGLYYAIQSHPTVSYHTHDSEGNWWRQTCWNAQQKSKPSWKRFRPTRHGPARNLRNNPTQKWLNEITLVA